MPGTDRTSPWGRGLAVLLVGLMIASTVATAGIAAGTTAATETTSATSVTKIASCTTIDTPGRYVIVPPGLTDETDSTCIEITADDVVIEGQNLPVDGVDANDSYGIYAHDVENLTIENVQATDWERGIYLDNVSESRLTGIDTSGGSGPASNADGVYLFGSDNVTIENGAAIADNGEHGIVVSGTNDVTIRSNRIENNGVGGVLVESVAVTRCITGCGIGTPPTFITFGYAADRAEIVRNDIEANGEYGIELNDSVFTISDEDSVDNATVRNNDLVGDRPSSRIPAHGIRLEGPVADSRIVRNDLEEHRNAIVLDGAASNTVEDNDVFNATFGVGLDQSIGTDVVDNEIEGAAIGMAALNDSNDTTVRDNRIIDSSAGIVVESSTQFAAVDNELNGVRAGIGIAADDARVRGNSLQDITGDGIVVTADGVRVVRNDVTNSSTAISLARSSGGIVRSNHVRESVTGLSLDGTDNNDVINNTLVDNGAGIELNESNNNRIEDNNASLSRALQFGPRADGIRLENNSDDNEILDNTVAGNDGSGISVFESDRNRLARNRAVDNVFFGIEMERSDDGDVVNNSVTNNGVGVVLNDSDDARIVDNNVSLNSGSFSGQGAGIVLFDGADDNELLDNVVADNTGPGIEVRDSERARVVDNNASDNAWGILVVNGDDTALESNNASANERALLGPIGIPGGGYGIAIIDSSGVESTGDVAMDNQLADVNVNGTGTARVSDLELGSATVSFEATNATVSGVERGPPGAPGNRSHVGGYVNVTGTASDAWVRINVSYASGNLGGIDESSIRLYRHDGGSWSNVSGSGANTSDKNAYANVSQFGVLAPFGEQSGPTGPGDVTGNGQPATDIDGDGLYEDIDGVSGFNAVDVTAFLDALLPPNVNATVANNPQWFDFNGDNTVDAVDVSTLLDILLP